MSAATIPLQVQTPQQQSPLQTVGGLMALRGQMGELALRQQQTQDIAQQTAIRQREVNDQNNVMEALKDPTQSVAIHNGDYSSIEGRVSPDMVNRLETTRIAQKNALMTFTKTQNEDRQNALTEVQTSARGLLSPGSDGETPDVGTINARLQGAKQYLAANGVLKRAGIGQLPDSVTGPDQVNQFIAGLGGELALHEQALKDQATAASAKESTGKGAQAQAEATKQELINAAMKQAQANPTQGTSLIDQAFPASLDPNINTSYKAAYAAHMAVGDVNGAAQTVGTAAGHAADLQKPGNPAMIAGEAAKAKAMQAATLPGDVAKAVATERAITPLKIQQAVDTQRAQYAGSPFANVPPKMLPQAMAESKAADDAYLSAVNQSNEMKSVLDMARAGNKVAYSYDPVLGVLDINAGHGTKRLNVKELGAYSGAGSLVDRLEGAIGKAVSGQSIPPQILDAMQQFHAGIAGSAQQAYQNNLARVKQRTGADLQPLVLPNTPGSATATIRARDPQGHLHEAPAGTALPAGWKAE